MITPEIANQSLRRFMKSICSHFAVCWPCAPMKRGLSNQRNPLSRCSSARVAATAVSSEMTRADQQHEREALHRGDAIEEEHERGDRRDDVRVENRVEALAVPGGDRGAHGLPGAHFFLDAFEDDDVRVGRDADRQDQAGEARQRQRHVEEQDRRVVEERVDREADHRDEAEEAVEHEQEERDDDQADSAACHACVSELLPSVAETSVRSICLKLTGSAPVWRTSARSFASPIEPPWPRSISAFGPGMPSGFVLEVDVRRRLELAVEHDREVLRVVLVVALAARSTWKRQLAAVGLLARDLLELVGAVVRELQRARRAAGLPEVGARAREHEVAAGHLGDRARLADACG